jgi:Flp pilus assembly pilin Flp
MAERAYRDSIVNRMQHRLLRLSLAVRGELGAVATEYSLVLLLVAIAIVAGVTLFGGALLGLFERAPAEFP